MPEKINPYQEPYPGASTDRPRTTPSPDLVRPDILFEEMRSRGLPVDDRPATRISAPDNRGMTVNLDILEADLRSRGLLPDELGRGYVEPYPGASTDRPRTTPSPDYIGPVEV